MSVQIKINNFEGPFDLLFHLIEKNEVDIYDIPIAEITNQYLEYINEMQKLDLEVASEFIVMAATLIQIKSRMLLPKKPNESDELQDDDDPRAELVEQLLQYKKYKNAAQILKNGEEESINIYYKNAEIIDDIEEDKLLLNINLDDLVNAFNNVMKKYAENTESETVEHEITRDEITVDDSMRNIRQMLKKSRKIIFRDLFEGSSGKLEIIMTFLALLELASTREVMITQQQPYGEILIERIDIEVQQ